MKEYEIGVPYDQETLKVLRCPVCGNDDFSQDADICKVCGLPLYNRCGDWAGYDEEFDSSNGHVNPPDARFCEKCGNRTSYFEKYHILKSWEEIKGIKKENVIPVPSDFTDDTIPF